MHTSNARKKRGSFFNLSIVEGGKKGGILISRREGRRLEPGKKKPMRRKKKGKRKQFSTLSMGGQDSCWISEGRKRNSQRKRSSAVGRGLCSYKKKIHL